MHPRNLGRTGMQVSPLCLGAVDVTLTTDVLDRIDEIVPPGVTISRVDAGYVPPALREPFARRRRTA